MDALELFRDWPTWRRAGAGRVLSSPAWRLDVMLGDARGVLRIVQPADAEFLWLEVDFEGERRWLGVPDQEAFAELHRVWSLRDRLPSEVRLALVEKDCGQLLQMLEDTMRRQLSLVGFADGEQPAGIRAFEVTFPGGEASALRFSLGLSPAMEIDLGRLENIDLSHESIRSLSRDVVAEYAVLDLPEEALAALGAGDLLLRPEDAESRWLLDPPEDGRVHVLAEEPGRLTFGELVDGDVPVPPAETFRIVRAGKDIATAVQSNVGTHPSFRITATLQPSNPPTL